MYLGIDVGTTATKAVLLGGDLRRIATASAVYAAGESRPGISEIDPDLWLAAVRDVLGCLRAEAPAAFAATRAIGLSGQMHSIVVLDENERPLRPAILWNDGRGAGQAQRLAADLPGLAEATGVRPMASFSAAKLLWLAEEAPADVAALRHILWAKDYVRLWLTGEHATDVSDAAGAQLLDGASRTWFEPVLDRLALPSSVLPRLLEGSDVSGRLKRGIAAELGLSAGIPVAAGGGDAATGALGLGCVREGQSFISLGTGAVLVTAETTFRPAPASLLHAFAHCLPGRWYQMAAMLNGASCLAFAAALCNEPDIEALLARAEALGPLPGRVLFQPYLRGERTPHNDMAARGAFVGLDADCRSPDLAKAVLEGVAFSLRQGLDLMRAAGSEPEGAIGLVGGGARSPLWCRIIATVLERPLHLVGDADFASAIGAARLGALADGQPHDLCTAPAPVDRIVEPDPKGVAAYRSRFADYLELYPALSGLPAAIS
ncbi:MULTISPECIES: xylulokinase [unclassified Aureimonas]|uniref:xylulokinase n=1 Tax=unclassified Aureimonas TaxID=2615206 RepID=UPI000701479D|nr:MULTISPECIES: xylulokinase [unclassified Aureimonas]KQT61229.1 xylulose kinase [Aureimonas sp. Leaf460]KQT68678.1 xylulose kinase [Aureimonas sp. Leaf427]